MVASCHLQPCIISSSDVYEMVTLDRILSPEETIALYDKGISCFVSNKAYVWISVRDVHHGSNIIGSHVVYHRKADAIANKSIFPLGYGYIEKYDVRRDASYLILKIMRLLLSLPAGYN